MCEVPLRYNIGGRRAVVIVTALAAVIAAVVGAVIAVVHER